MNKKRIMIIYTVLLIFGVIISLVIVLSEKYNFKISDKFIVVTVIIPSIITVIYGAIYVQKLYQKKRLFIQKHLDIISSILCDTITTTNKSINIKKETGILFDSIFHHDYNNGIIYLGNKYRYCNINLFNYTDINDPHSAHIILFDGLMIQVQMDSPYSSELYAIKKRFYEFDECAVLNKRNINTFEIDNINISFLSYSSDENNMIKKLLNIGALLKKFKWCAYVHNNLFTLIIKSYKVYDFMNCIRTEGEVSDAQSVIKNDTYFIKKILYYIINKM